MTTDSPFSQKKHCLMRLSLEIGLLYLPGIITVLHKSKPHSILAHHIDKRHNQPLHEGLDRAEIGPSNARWSIHQKYNIGCVDIGADHCKKRAGSSTGIFLSSQHAILMFDELPPV